MTKSKEQAMLNITDYIDQKCHDCFGRGLVRQRVFYEGKWRSANLMCECIEQTVKKMAKVDTSIQVKDLLARILMELKSRKHRKRTESGR